MIDPIRQQQAVELANELIGRNTPIEAIIEQTGLPRTTVNNLVNSQLNISRPPLPAAQPTGIGGLQSGIPQNIADVMPNLGTDIADYLTDELGFNPAQENFEDLTYRQQLNIADAKNAIESNDPTSEMTKNLRNQSATQDLSDDELAGLTREALREYYGERAKEYADLIKTPDAGLPYLVAGLSLIESGAEGDTWGDATSKAIAKGLVEYKKGKSLYETKVTDLQIKNLMAADASYMDLFKKNIEYNMKLQNERLTGARKDYIITKRDGSTFIEPLTSVEVADAKALYGAQNIKEYDKDKDGALLNYKITYNDKNGNPQTIVTGLTDEQATVKAKQVEKGELINIERAGNDPSANKLPFAYKLKDQPNSRFIYSSGTLDDINNFKNDSRFEVREGGKAGELVEVRNLVSGNIEWIPKINATVRQDKYELLNDDVVTSITQEDGPDIAIGKASAIKTLSGDTNVAKTNLKDDNQQALNRNYTSGLILTNVNRMKKVVTDSDNPDLLFNNIAGSAVKPALNILTTLNAIGDALKSPVGTNLAGTPIQKFDFVYRDADGNLVESSYQDMFNRIKNAKDENGNSYFQDFGKTGVGQFLETAGAEQGVLEAGLFNLAILSAASMGGSEETDMRAISDKDLITQMQRVGKLATTANTFVSVIDNFLIETLLSERALLEKQKLSASTGRYDTTRLVNDPQFGVTLEGEPKQGKVAYSLWDGSKQQKYAEDRIAEIDEIIAGLGSVDPSFRTGLDPVSVAPMEIKPVGNYPMPNTVQTGLSIGGINNATVLDAVNYYLESSDAEKPKVLLEEFKLNMSPEVYEMTKEYIKDILERSGSK